jgi:hypothetical protein
MVDHLPDGPAAGAVRCIELGVIQAANGFAEMRGRGGDLADPFRNRLACDGRWSLKLADGVAEIHFEILAGGALTDSR